MFAPENRLTLQHLKVIQAIVAINIPQLLNIEDRWLKK